MVLGEAVRVDGFALAGAATIRAENPDAVREACDRLPDDVAVLVLTHNAALALGENTAGLGTVLSVVMPP